MSVSVFGLLSVHFHYCFTLLEVPAANQVLKALVNTVWDVGTDSGQISKSLCRTCDFPLLVRCLIVSYCDKRMTLVSVDLWVVDQMLNCDPTGISHNASRLAILRLTEKL